MHTQDTTIPAPKATDILFTHLSKPDTAAKAGADARETGTDDSKGGTGKGTSSGGFNIKKVSIDLNNTQRQGNIVFAGNESLFNVNLLERIMKSSAALWRNPVRTRTAHWGRQEVMHVFNGWFHQTITDYEKYETFGKCYTAPDPFRNDDPPWKPVFC